MSIFLPFVQSLTQDFTYSRHSGKPLWWMDESESHRDLGWTSSIFTELNAKTDNSVGCPQSCISIKLHFTTHKNTFDVAECVHMHLHTHTCAWVCILVPPRADIHLFCTQTRHSPIHIHSQVSPPNTQWHRHMWATTGWHPHTCKPACPPDDFEAGTESRETPWILAAVAVTTHHVKKKILVIPWRLQADFRVLKDPQNWLSSDFARG